MMKPCPIARFTLPGVLPLLWMTAAGCWLLASVGGALAAAPEAPKGFGNIPFGAAKTEALRLNAGNGKLAELPDKTATFTYDTVIAGLPFQVVQKFDDAGRAVDATVGYTSHEGNAACVDRFNYVLGKLTERYGKPSNVPALRREAAAGSRSDSYTLEFGFRNGTAITAVIKSVYPVPAAGGKPGGGPPPAAGGTAGAESCDITLHYLPPRWTARF